MKAPVDATPWLLIFPPHTVSQPAGGEQGPRLMRAVTSTYHWGTALHGWTSQNSVSLFFKRIYSSILERERACAHEREKERERGMGQGRGRERIPIRLPAEHGARHRA